MPTFGENLLGYAYVLIGFDKLAQSDSADCLNRKFDCSIRVSYNFCGIIKLGGPVLSRISFGLYH